MPHLHDLRYDGSTQRWEVEHNLPDLAERIQPCFACDRHMPVCPAVKHLELGSNSIFDAWARFPFRLQRLDSKLCPFSLGHYHDMSHDSLCQIWLQAAKDSSRSAMSTLWYWIPLMDYLAIEGFLLRRKAIALLRQGIDRRTSRKKA